MTMNNRAQKNILKSQSGILTVDYIFAIVLAMGFMAILFAMSLTLTVVDLVQYITFSSARTYTVAHISEARSKERAAVKYSNLISSKVMTPLLKNKWFKVDELPRIGDMRDFGLYPATSLGAELKNYYFYGVSVDFQAKALDFNIPFYGSTHTGSEDEGFQTKIHSFLGREPSLKECMDLNKERWRWILDEYPEAQSHSSLQKYEVFADNGC